MKRTGPRPSASRCSVPTASRTSTPGSRARLPLEKFLASYYDNWRMPWPLYRDIFLYAREQQLPMRGLNIPEGISKKIAGTGIRCH